MSTNNNSDGRNNDDAIIDALSCLQAYESVHANGNSKLKSCMWNIFKARRDVGALHLGSGNDVVAFTATQVREELRARALLEVKGDEVVEDDVLVDEDGFTLHLNGIPTSTEGDDDSNIENVIGSKNSVLRQRRKQDNPSTSETTIEASKNKNIWTTEAETNDDDDEDIRLRKTDPIVLFGGLSPPSLKEAQKDARDSLQHYIEAANLVSAMLKLME